MCYTNPVAHFVRVGVSVVVVEDEYGGDDRRGDHEHDAVEVGAEERHCIRRRRHRLGHHIEEHGQRQQDRYTCRYVLVLRDLMRECVLAIARTHIL